MPDIKHTFSVTTETVYVIVHSTEGSNFGSCGDLAQFGDKQKAVMVARALHDAHPGSELKVRADDTGAPSGAGPNACAALSQASEFWDSATGPLSLEEGRS